MSQRPLNPFAMNQKLESMSPKDAELSRQALVAELKSKIEATEQRYQDEQKSQAAAATKEKEADTESTETLESKLAKTENTV
jgi:biotin-(acetyl-CoA carboxylase) ligase